MVEVNPALVPEPDGPLIGEVVTRPRSPGSGSGLNSGKWSLPLIAYLAVLVLVFIFVAAASASYVYNQTHSTARSDAAADANFAAASASHDISLAVSTLQGTVAKLAATPGIGAALTSSTCTLSFAGAGDFTIGHLDITRADGAVACTSLPAARSASYRDMPWLAQALAAPVFIGPIKDPASNQLSFVSAAPIAGAAGVVAGFVSLNPVATSIASRLSGPRHLEFLITNQNGSLALARSLEPTKWVATPLAGTPFFGSSGLTRPDVGGTPRIYGRSTVPNLGWMVYAGADQAATEANADSVFRSQLAIILTGLAVMLLATGLVYRQITRPISQMSSAIRVARQRGFAGPIRVRGATEVMILADDYNALVAAVQHELARRQEVENGIQKQVAERTAELRTANAELEEASRHKSQFLANMSHELRTPLNAILGFSELMIDDTSGRHDQATRLKFMRQIHSSGRHLLALINDILDLSKVEAGRMSLQLETVKVGLIVDQVVTSLQPLADKKGIHLEAETGSAGELSADGAKLSQMLINLVSNGIKFTPEGGRVEIEARRTDGAVAISVADTGIGIAEADRVRLFQAFEQLETGNGRRQEGTGLGLALTRRLAQLHGGDVTVESEPGKGSVFTITLPLRPQKSSSLPALPVAGENGPLVLVVEDNVEAAHLLARQLDQGGFRTEIAVNAVEALEKATRLRPIAITLDVLLPDVDGWHVLTQLKRDPETRDIPVVVISVLDEPELGRALGALDYLVKPVDRADLLRALDRHAFTRKVSSQEVRILLVDDEPANLAWLDSILTPAGYKVTSASGGSQGIEMARRNQPDLVLLDLMMPDVDGFDVVEALHEEEATRSIPIMILTAKDLTEADKRQLNGHVGAILARGSTSAPDLLAWLQRLTTPRGT